MVCWEKEKAYSLGAFRHRPVAGPCPPERPGVSHRPGQRSGIAADRAFRFGTTSPRFGTGNENCGRDAMCRVFFHHGDPEGTELHGEKGRREEGRPKKLDRKGRKGRKEVRVPLAALASPLRPLQFSSSPHFSLLFPLCSPRSSSFGLRSPFFSVPSGSPW